LRIIKGTRFTKYPLNLLFFLPLWRPGLMSNYSLRNICRYLVVASMVTLGATGLSAQNASQIAAPVSNENLPSYDIFLGYSYFNAHAQLSPFNIPYSSITTGGTVSGSLFFTRRLGVEIAFVDHNGTADKGSDNDGFNSISAGGIYRFPVSNFTPFVHALFGGARIVGPNNDAPTLFEHEPPTWGPALTVGGGLDYNTGIWGHRLSFRLIQADFRYAHADFGTPYARGIPVYGTPWLGGSTDLKGVDLSAGIVLHPGYTKWTEPVSYSCSVTTPTGTIYPGDIVTISGTPEGLSSKRSPSYTWAADGVPVSGTSNVVSVDTKTLRPGTYTVRGHVAQGSRQYEVADCTTQFTVSRFAPPTVSCSANPSTVNPDEPSTITASGMSPQNRPLTYSYSATAGEISGNTSTATLSTNGAAPGSTITVSCDVVDDRSQTASSTTTVMIAAPPPPPPAATISNLCTIGFDNDSKHPSLIDNEGKACLDDIALSAMRDAHARLAIVGNAMDGEVMADHKAAERAVNAKAYLVREKGLDPARISVYTGTADARNATTNLIPQGATFDDAGLSPVDESAVKPAPGAALLPGKHRRN
jgi:hypothetical protein